MKLLEDFLSPSFPSLKVCGVTTTEDADKLVNLKVEALGINFWEKSKRYCSPENAKSFSPDLAGSILRVGVFVNAAEKQILNCFEEDLIDVAQFHGDETVNDLESFSQHNLPFIRAVSVMNEGQLPNFSDLPTNSILLDAHAPGVYGGTGETIDWSVAAQTVKAHPSHSILLAGGITPENADEAANKVKPCALDVASGAESSPGIKDFKKIKRLQEVLKC